MDLSRIAGKPAITYEINIHKPHPWRAEFPLILAAYYSAQDWDGAFWYYWSDSINKPPKDYADLHSRGLYYSSTSNPWGGVQVYPDEVLLGSLRLAGEIFLSGAIRANEQPARIVIGPDDLIFSPARISAWLNLIYADIRTRGMVLDFSATSSSPPGPEAVPDASVKTSRLGPEVTFDHVRRQMTGTSARARMFVGWPHETTVSLGEGLALHDMKPGQFIAFAAVSQDGQPITQSHKILMTALCTSDNTGFQYNPKATTETGWMGMLKSIVNFGQGPAQIVWPKLAVSLKGRQGTVTWANAFPEKISTEPVDGSVVFDGQRPAAWGEVSFR